MKKQLLIAAAALVLAVCAQARVITPGEGQIWWGYFSSNDVESITEVGTGSPMTLMAGIYIPANHPQIGQATVKAVRIYFRQNLVSTLSNLKIWISKELPNKIDDADYKQNLLGTPSAGANDYNLRTPFEINNTGFYIGYCVTSTSGYSIGSGGNDAPNSFWIGNPTAGLGWTDLNGNGLGKLAFQILVEGADIPATYATASDFGQNLTLQGEIASVPVTITNLGTDPVNSITYTIATEGGSTTEPQELKLGDLSFNSSVTVSVPFLPDAETRKYHKTFTITHVNGTPNTTDDNSANGFLITLKEKQPVTPVIEEFTGTWCGWCPRGIVGMEKIHEAYGNQVVQIAAHNGDPMAIDAYKNFIYENVGGFPSSFIDRQYDIDPSYSALNYYVKLALGRTAPAAIELKAEWENADQNSVVFNTTTRFSYNDEKAQYAIAYVLVEDGLTGTGSNWAQANYYRNGGSGGEMDFWYKANSSVTGLEFNHVAVAGWGIDDGINGSVSSIINVNTPQQYSKTYSISGNSLIQDKSKLTAVALLIDRFDGTIVNAAQSPIVEKGTAINAPTAGFEAPEARYTIDGRSLQHPSRGLNIIRMTDGTVKKVMVK